MKNPIIEYPCKWSYRIIGTDEQELRNAAIKCLGDLEHHLSIANRSSSEKYISLNIETTVSSEETRNRIHAALNNHPSIKMTL